MPEGYEVDPDEVRAHAKTIHGFAGRAGKATEAGAHLSGLDDAYGILCQPFGSMLNEPQNRGTDALRKTEEVTTKLAENLDKAASEYQKFEDRVIELLEKIARSVDQAGGAVPKVGNR